MKKFGVYLNRGFYFLYILFILNVNYFQKVQANDCKSEKVYSPSEQYIGCNIYSNHTKHYFYLLLPLNCENYCKKVKQRKLSRFYDETFEGKPLNQQRLEVNLGKPQTATSKTFKRSRLFSLDFSENLTIILMDNPLAFENQQNEVFSRSSIKKVLLSLKLFAANLDAVPSNSEILEFRDNLTDLGITPEMIKNLPGKVILLNLLDDKENANEFLNFLLGWAEDENLIESVRSKIFLF